MKVQSTKIIEDNELKVIMLEDLLNDELSKYYKIIFENFSLLETCKPDYELFKNYFKEKNCELYFYKNNKNNEIIGACMIQKDYNDIKDIVYLSDFCINKEHRNKGFGKDFLIKIIEKLKEKDLIKLYLDIEITNEIGIKLYTKNGFIIEKKIETEMYKDYYILSYLL